MPDPDRAENLAQFVVLLGKLRSWAGMPPYRHLAKRVGPLMRPPRIMSSSTVMDAFRVDRRRLDLDLVVAIVRALGADDDATARWREACIKVHETAKSGRSAAGLDQPPADLPEFAGREELARLIEAALLRRHGPAPVGEAGVVYNALPPDTAAFTGRQSEIDEITERVAAAAEHGGVIGISAIGGMAGVGKSTLAVHVAHLLADRFPSRQLFVDLHAHTASKAPADPAATLAGLLTGDGLDPRQLPTGLPQLSALWRTRMAGRRTLLVLDNAADSAQVAPLLPGGTGSLVLITSRRHLGDLPYAVAEVSLDVMPPADAMAMFLSLAPRAVGQEKQVADLVELAGFLPLAISLLARVYAKHRTWSMDELIGETRDRLLTLSAEQGTVAAAFDLSYQALPPARRRFFRLLGLHPGSDLDPYAAAALTDTTPSEAEAHLDALHGDHLATEPSYRRYGMHDLIRAHARAHTENSDPIEQRDFALDRLLNYYAHTAHTTSTAIARLPRPGLDEPVSAHARELRDREAARAWLRAEYANLEAAFVFAQAHRLDRHAIALAAGLAEILQADGPWSRAVQIHQVAVEAAERLDHPAARATALTDLGRARYMTGDLPGAADAQRRALDIYREVGNRDGEANTLTYLGRVLVATGDLPGAADALTRALEIYRQVGNRDGEANTLDNLGRVRHLAGDFSGAAQAQARALEIYSRSGNRHGEATTLTDLGRVQYTIGDYPQAADTLTRALEMYRQIGNRNGEANTLTDMGNVQYLTSDYLKAADTLTRALEIYRQIGNRNGEANALDKLGRVQCAIGDYPEAAETLARALEILRQIGNRLAEASALNHYAAAIAAGDRSRAVTLYHQALAMNRELSKPDDEAASLEGIAEHHLATGDAARGTEYLRQALQIYQRLGMRPDAERVQARLTDPDAH